MLSLLDMSKDIRKITDDAKVKAGGPSALAKAIGGITSQAVSNWDKIPMKRVYQVAAILGVQPHELRPDVIPVPHKKGAA